MGAAPELTWSDGDIWTTSVDLAPGDVHFKVRHRARRHMPCHVLMATRVWSNDMQVAIPNAATAVLQFVRVSDGGEHWEDCHDRSLQVALVASFLLPCDECTVC